MNDAIADIFSQLRRDEGVRKFPYADTAGKVTVGVGHNLNAHGLDDDVIQLQLVNDVAETTEQVHSRLPWFPALDVVRQGVIVNMAFNLGFSKLEGFPKFLAACAHGDWETAADEMLSSAWAKEVGERAVRLAQQMRTGVWV